MPSNCDHTLLAPSAQATLPQLELWDSEVVPHLPADLDAQARALGAFRRRRAIACASDLLRGLLASVLLASSLQHLAAWALLADLADISAPAWQKRLVRSSAFLLWLLGELLAAPPPSVRLLPRTEGTILLVDATTLRQPGGTGDDWRLHTAYNFTHGRLSQISLTDRSGGEHLGYYQLQPGDIVVADNGYGYRRSVATVRKQQAHLLIRVRPDTFPFELSDGQRLDVLAQLRKRGPSVREWQGWCTDADGERYRVRLIASKLPPQQAAAARQRARRSAQKHGRKLQASTLLVAGWVLLISTLEHKRWTAEAVLRLYRVRWQVELVFKRMKSLLRLGGLRGRTRESIEASIRALLVAWALQEAEAAWVRQQLARLVPDAAVITSSWRLTAVSVELLRHQVRGNWGQARLQACLRRLSRFLTSRLRQQREHQETAVRAWLERRPLPSRLSLQDAA